MDKIPGKFAMIKETWREGLRKRRINKILREADQLLTSEVIVDFVVRDHPSLVSNILERLGEHPYGVQFRGSPIIKNPALRRDQRRVGIMKKERQEDPNKIERAANQKTDDHVYDIPECFGPPQRNKFTTQATVENRRRDFVTGFSNPCYNPYRSQLRRST